MSALAAEWTKARTVPATTWLLAALAVALVAVGPLVLAATDPAATATAVLGLLYAGPLLTRLVADPAWADRLARLSPTAGTAVQATTDLGDLPVAPWPALAVTAAYAAAVAAAGLVALRRRDV